MNNDGVVDGSDLAIVAKHFGEWDPYHAFISHKHARVNSMLRADLWFEPVVAFETLGAEITLSSIRTCAMDDVRKGSGLAIRFPRFAGNFRFDKATEDATTSTEIVEIYQRQLKKIA